MTVSAAEIQSTAMRTPWPESMRIVAEIGLNHFGSDENAERMLRSLLETEVDAITFQIREPSFYVEGESWRKALRPEFYQKACALTRREGKGFGLAVADSHAVSIVDADFWKSLSWDLLNAELHSALGSTGRKTYVSTGLGSLEDVRLAAQRPGDYEFIQTQLVAEIESANLQAIPAMREATGRSVAFGLHCADHRLLYLALGFRPSAIFFYVREENPDPSPDHAHALPIALAGQWARDLKRLALGVGTGHKERMKRGL
jgi:sialic acid synthase SpsE